MKSLTDEQIKALPDFPKKMLFSNFSEKTIENRKNKFENYLNKLSEITNFIESPEVCAFLEIDSCTRILLASLDFEIKEEQREGFEFPKEDSKDLDSGDQRKETKKIYGFLKRINSKPLMIAKEVQELDKCYFQPNAMELTKEEIKTLLWGNENLKGLLHFCGIVENYIGGVSCLQLFAKFLRFEYNSEAAKFMDVFAMAEPSLIKQMHLENYIKEITSLDGSGLLTLYYYLQYNYHHVSLPEEILEDQESIDEYKKWIQNKVVCKYLTCTTTVHKSSSKDTMAGPSEEEDETAAEIIEKAVSLIKIEPTLVDYSRSFSEKNINLLIQELDGYCSWNLIDISNSDSIKIYYKGKENFRITMQLKADNLLKVVNFFHELDQRAKWNKLCWRSLNKDATIVDLMYPEIEKKSKFIEYILNRKIEERDGYVMEIAWSLGVPSAEIENVRRVHINGHVTKFTQKIDTEGQKYVECQMLWAVEEGYKNLAEYSMCIKKEMEHQLDTLNEIMQTN